MEENDDDEERNIKKGTEKERMRQKEEYRKK